MTRNEQYLYQKFGIRFNPFPQSGVAKKKPEVFWKPQSQINLISRIRDLLQNKKNTHKMFLITGDLGFGKTHHLYQIQSYFGKEYEKYIPIYLDFNTIQYGISSTIRNVLREFVHHKKVKPLKNQITTSGLKMESLKNFTNDNQSMEKYKQHAQYLTALMKGEEEISSLQKKDVEFLTDLFKTLLSFCNFHEYNIILLIDELEDLLAEDIKSREMKMSFLRFIRSTIDEYLQGIVIVMAITYEGKDIMENKLYKAISDRVLKDVQLKELKKDEVKEFVSEYLNICKNKKRDIRPFDKALIERIFFKTKGIPRKIVKECYNLLHQIAEVEPTNIKKFMKEYIASNLSSDEINNLNDLKIVEDPIEDRHKKKPPLNESKEINDKKTLNNFSQKSDIKDKNSSTEAFMKQVKKIFKIIDELNPYQGKVIKGYKHHREICEPFRKTIILDSSMSDEKFKEPDEVIILNQDKNEKQGKKKYIKVTKDWMKDFKSNCLEKQPKKSAKDKRVQAYLLLKYIRGE